MTPLPPAMRPLLLALAATLALTSCASERVTLALRPTPGERWQVALALEQEMRQELGDAELETRQETGLSWTEEVVGETPDGGARVRMTWDAARLGWEDPGGQIRWSSDDDAAENPPPLFAVVLDAMVGESLECVLAPDGSIRPVDDPAVFVDRVLARVQPPPGVDVAELRHRLRRDLGPGTVLEMLRGFGSLYPPAERGEVAAGDTWTSSTRSARPFPIEHRTTYELVRVHDETLVVRVRSKLHSVEGTAPGLAAGTSVDLTGTQRGRLELDRATGRVLVAELVQDLAGTLTLRSPDGEELESKVELRGRVQLAATR